MPQSEFYIGGKVFLDNNLTNNPDFIIEGEAKGEGGSAVVFFARQQKVNNRMVAIKLFRKIKWFQLYLEKEIKGLTEVNEQCPDAAIRVYDQSENQKFVVLEYAQITLGDFIADAKKLSTLIPLKEVYDIIVSLVRKVACIHQKVKRIHRDLKPDNIFFIRKGEIETLRVGDFATSIGSTFTKDFTRLPGTFAFTGPEVFAGKAAGNEYTLDVFSLGMILYVLLDGMDVLPKEKLSPEEYFNACMKLSQESSETILRKITKGTYKRSIDFNDQNSFGLYIALLKIAAKALRPNPANRYQNADEMLKDLKEWEGQLAVITLGTHHGTDRNPVKVKIESQDHYKEPLDFEVYLGKEKKICFPDNRKIKVRAKLPGHKTFEEKIELTAGKPFPLLIRFEKTGQINEWYFYGSLLFSLFILYPMILNLWVFGYWGSHLPALSSKLIIDWFSLTIWNVRIYLSTYSIFLAPLGVLHYWSRKVDESGQILGKKVSDFSGYMIINLVSIVYLFGLILIMTSFEGPVLSNNDGKFFDIRFLSELKANDEELQKKIWYIERGLILALPCKSKKFNCEAEYQIGAKILKKFSGNMPDIKPWDDNEIRKVNINPEQQELIKGIIFSDDYKADKIFANIMEKLSTGEWPAAQQLLNQNQAMLLEHGNKKDRIQKLDGFLKNIKQGDIVSAIKPEILENLKKAEEFYTSANKNASDWPELENIVKERLNANLNRQQAIIKQQEAEEFAKRKDDANNKFQDIIASLKKAELEKAELEIVRQQLSENLETLLQYADDKKSIQLLDKFFQDIDDGHTLSAKKSETLDAELEKLKESFKSYDKAKQNAHQLPVNIKVFHIVQKRLDDNQARQKEIQEQLQKENANKKFQEILAKLETGEIDPAKKMFTYKDNSDLLNKYSNDKDKVNQLKGFFQDIDKAGELSSKKPETLDNLKKAEDFYERAFELTWLPEKTVDIVQKRLDDNRKRQKAIITTTSTTVPVTSHTTTIRITTTTLAAKEVNSKNRFELRNDRKVVYDSVTGLYWQQSGSATVIIYKEAEEYIKELNKGKGFAGYNDWRLPTIDELKSLITKEVQSNSMFINTIFDKYQQMCWSSTISSSVSLGLAKFYDGNVAWTDLRSCYWVRAVRP